MSGWKAWLLPIAAVIAGVQWASSRPLERRPGVIAPDEPLQVELEAGAAIDAGHDYRLTPRAQFSATVRVLARERYFIDALAPVAPVDLAVGWGRMSDSAVIDALEISQSARFYHWRADALPIPRKEVETHSANWHMVPANTGIARKLRRLRAGEVVRLGGRLVDVAGPDGGGARTSLRRDDTGAGACEIILVDSLETLAG
jgi:hypothetical protein